ncbi:hypothetical protein CSUI_007202, partial [Cystoisospora suis]
CSVRLNKAKTSTGAGAAVSGWNPCHCTRCYRRVRQEAGSCRSLESAHRKTLSAVKQARENIGGRSGWRRQCHQRSGRPVESRPHKPQSKSSEGVGANEDRSRDEHGMENYKLEDYRDDDDDDDVTSALDDRWSPATSSVSSKPRRPPSKPLKGFEVKLV